ncbi:MAG: polynucleotide adenylyltransferase PcnB [Betaproteobacteria bacterium]|nr:polynucleotide adenylyltransferase PcnB [Betaproteobacteria bacterium]
MIKSLIRKVFRLQDGTEATVLSFAKHGIRRDAISPGARKVCDALTEAGFEAYVVGGAVRDLMLGVQPKDYDVATNATPDQVHKQIRRSRLIGRRFKLVHAMFGDETVEVSTFRAETPSETDEHGRVLRDNIFGTRAQDAARRDFTINALYYDPTKEQVLDYHRGAADLKAKIVRIIGDPEARYREDPVRMLRAVRFAAKLGFQIDQKTREPIDRLGPLIENVPAARLFDEMQKLLLSGHAHACVHRLREEGLHRGMMPLLDVILEQPLGERFVNLALQQTDDRIRTDKGVSPAFLLAALLWHEVLAAWKSREEEGERTIPSMMAAMDEVLDIQTEKLAIPRRFTTTMREIWVLQPRLENRTGKRAMLVLEHPRFRAAYDFLALRAASGEAQQDLVDWWTKFQIANDAERGALLATTRASGEKPRRRRRRKPVRDSDERREAPAGDESGSGR